MTGSRAQKQVPHSHTVHSNCTNILKKHSIHFFGLLHPMSNQMLRLEDENATFPAGSPRHVIRRGIWCPVQALGTIKCSKSENSSVFLQISPCPWLKCWWEREGEIESERAYRIRPLGVTVLSRIRPAPSHKHTHSHTVTKWCHVGASIVQERWVWLSVCRGSTERALCSTEFPSPGTGD